MITFIQFIKEQSIAGGFGIARCDMPQIKDYQKFTSFLGSKSIEYRYSNTNIQSIKPIQKDIDLAKVDSIDLSKTKPVIISNDGYLLDGHHRFFAVKNSGKDEIETLIILYPINKLLRLAYEFMELE